ncbi:hypothetical protein GCM10010442_15510 [Kitasatospora kifunensis]|uniref:Uncharacterized protein n=1 Tax=Kitasatospora kifunensis TaxID=58351 RepID=A0A7W7QXT2_KITKI|nr:hypothetical protein [Kitasatospora kifunensis]
MTAERPRGGYWELHLTGEAAPERPAGTTVNDCGRCQYLDAFASQHVGNAAQMASVVRLRTAHALECAHPRGGSG